jgi:hypothetical protein
VTVLSLSDYLPASELAKIVAVTLAVAVVAPSAVSLAVAGLDRRAAGSTRLGDALIGIGACVLVLLVAAGLYALVNR